jgi:hypothetical protein
MIVVFLASKTNNSIANSSWMNLKIGNLSTAVVHVVGGIVNTQVRVLLKLVQTVFYKFSRLTSRCSPYACEEIFVARGTAFHRKYTYYTPEYKYISGLRILLEVADS